MYISMIKASPTTCFVAESTSGAVVGYAVSHPHDSCISPPPLNLAVPSYADPRASASLFVHDICVSPDQKGKGLGSRLMNYLLGNETSGRCVTLVAVRGAETLWGRFGFEIRDCEKEALVSFDETAKFMLLCLDEEGRRRAEAASSAD